MSAISMSQIHLNNPNSKLTIKLAVSEVDAKCVVVAPIARVVPTIEQVAAREIHAMLMAARS